MKRGDERGAVMIFFALLLVALVIMIALVIDLGMARADRKTNKSTSDQAAAAGLLALEDKAAGDGRPHPWRGVCAAYNFVKANGSELESFDLERWTDQQDLTTLLTDPCSDPARLATACVPGVRTTYAQFHGEADDGRITVDIKSGYAMPDASFSDDAQRAGDNGDPAEQGCDHLAVIINERRPPSFSSILKSGGLATRVRSVGRATLGSGFDAPVALLLLERTECRSLWVQSVDSRVIVEHSDDNGPAPGTNGIWPGLIHSDSDGSACAVATPPTEYVLEGRVGTAGPTILAKHATLPHPETNSILPARISVFAKYFAGRPANTPFPSTIGESDPVAAQRQGRSRIDDKYLAGIQTLAAQAQALLVPNDPPLDVAHPWTVYSGGGCTINDGVLPAPTTPGDPNKLWFRCTTGPNGLWLKGTGALRLTTPDMNIVVTGKLRIDAPFEVTDLRTLWVRGATGPNALGIDAQADLKLNTGGTAGPPCPVDANGQTPAGKTASVYVGAGAFEMKSSGNPAKVFRACSTFMLIKGGVALPSTPGTLPIPSCAAAAGAVNNNGPFSVSAGGFVQEWTAPNELNDVQPTPAYLAAHPTEDLALWTEAAQNSTITGGGGTIVKGVFFLPNAHDFTIVGSGSGDMPANAQFIACKMKVNGNATLRMVPDAYNFVLVPSFLGFELVR